MFTKCRSRSIFEFLPVYLAADFDEISPAGLDDQTFRVLFAERVTREKGALAVIEVADLLRSRRCSAIEFNICSKGSALSDAHKYVDGVAQEVEPDDVQGYANALEELYRVRMAAWIARSMRLIGVGSSRSRTVGRRPWSELSAA